MKNEKAKKTDRKIELDPETIADLEVDDSGADHIKGGRTLGVTCNCDGGGGDATGKMA